MMVIGNQILSYIDFLLSFNSKSKEMEKNRKIARLYLRGMQGHQVQLWSAVWGR